MLGLKNLEKIWGDLEKKRVSEIEKMNTEKKGEKYRNKATGTTKTTRELYVELVNPIKRMRGRK